MPACLVSFLFFQAEDGIRDKLVTGVQTCALPIWKESLALDLRSDEGKRIARALIDRADVVIDNFLPAQRESLGLTAMPERVIHCSITGFDGDTAGAKTPGYEE